jgi:hypothetical protein
MERDPKIDPRPFRPKITTVRSGTATVAAHD